MHGRLVELDPELGRRRARRTRRRPIEVLCADAGAVASYEGAVPADLVLVCGVFGNITDADMCTRSRRCRRCARPGATVIWTRHRRPPDATPMVRARFAATGFEEVAFDAPAEVRCSPSARTASSRTPRPFDAARAPLRLRRLRRCSTTPARSAASPTTWAGPRSCRGCASDARAFVDRFGRARSPPDSARGPAPDVWSPLEYACHVRDVLRVQRERVELAQREDEPTFAPMRRDERVVEDRYNEQDPAVVAAEILAAADALDRHARRPRRRGWQRTGIYNYPEPALRTVEWIAIHTAHELLHHRVDIGTLA